MNDLPNECLLRIFELVEPIEQIANCRLVCKQWYSVLSGLRLKTLVIASCASLPNSRWWYTYGQVNCRHLIRSEQTLESIQLKLNQPLFNNLRALFIYGVHDKSLLASSLSKFQQLEQLEVIYSQLKNEASAECVLSLRNLRILNLGDAINDRIVLDTPRLTCVKINLSNIEKITFRFPERIRHFESLRYSDHIKNFVNLEVLKLKNINVLDDDFLEHFGQLKELHFDTKKEIFYVLKHQKRVYRRNALKLFYFGVHLDECIPSEELKNSRHQINKKAIELFGDNYRRMASVLPFVHQIDYCDLEEYFDDKIPTDFIGRFVSLDYLIATRKIKYANQLIRILGECSSLSSLALDSSLSQSFFNSLPVILYFLKYLIVKNEQKLNFNEFLLGFNSLELIYVRHSLPIELVEKIFHKYKKLIFSFVYHAKNVTVRSLRTNEFKLEVDGQPNSSNCFECLDDLFMHLKFNLSF